VVLLCSTKPTQRSHVSKLDLRRGCDNASYSASAPHPLRTWRTTFKSNVSADNSGTTLELLHWTVQ
jgi:hypothetical protein